MDQVQVIHYVFLPKKKKVIHDVTLNNITPLYIVSLDANFDKFTLHFLLISIILANFKVDQKSIAISSIKCLNCKFLQFIIMHSL